MIKKSSAKGGSASGGKNLLVLGVETSCDETAAAVISIPRPSYELRVTSYSPSWYRGLRVLSNVVASQVKTHAKTGGVVPEVAAREHVKAILPTIRAALQIAARKLLITNYPATAGPRLGGGQLLRPDVIAVTNGPGLITSLMVGVETARTLSAAWNVPLVAVNHLEGHIMAALLQNPNSKILNPKQNQNSNIKHQRLGFGALNFEFPAVVLLVSGGHTELVLMRKWLDYHVIGETLDDAAGEAFDKVARILGFGYPGGPAIEAAAKRGNPNKEPFTPPMLDSGDFNFSFSGIKTAVLYRKLEIGNWKLEIRNDIAAGFQKAVVDVLVAKTACAAQQYKAKTVLLCGGVAANGQLRSRLAEALRNQSKKLLITDCCLLIPPLHYCTDNAAMIAAAGALRALHGKFTKWQKVEADPTLAL